MTVLKLAYYPAEILKQKTREITEITPEIKQLAADMIETMYANSGIGLAAPQVHKDLRLTVIDLSEERNQAEVLINPRIIKKSGSSRSEEGCLSIPGYRESIKRAEIVTVQAVDLNGAEVIIEGAEDLYSYCLQHEIDHLDGILFTDYLKGIKKALFERWLKKNLPLENE